MLPQEEGLHWCKGVVCLGPSLLLGSDGQWSRIIGGQAPVPPCTLCTLSCKACTCRWAQLCLGTPGSHTRCWGCRGHCARGHTQCFLQASHDGQCVSAGRVEGSQEASWPAASSCCFQAGLLQREESGCFAR